MCSITRYRELEEGRELLPTDMAFCPCLQVAGKFHGENFSLWIEKNTLTATFGIKEKHFSNESQVRVGPEAETPMAVYLTGGLGECFVAPLGTTKPSDAIRIGWVSFPERCKGILGTFAEELVQWAQACCKS